MSNQTVLVVSDDAPRRNFLFRIFKDANMNPISYPVTGAYYLHLAEDEPTTLVVDVQMPVEQKIKLVIKAMEKYPQLKVILIGKRDYIVGTGIFEDSQNVVICDRIEELQMA